MVEDDIIEGDKELGDDALPEEVDEAELEDEDEEKPDELEEGLDEFGAETPGMGRERE